MRTEAEIQRAHDLLTSIITRPRLMKNVIHTDDRNILTATCDVLCWVLQHEHNGSFAHNISGLEKALKGLGYEMRERATEETVN